MVAGIQSVANNLWSNLKPPPDYVNLGSLHRARVYVCICVYVLVRFRIGGPRYCIAYDMWTSHAPETRPSEVRKTESPKPKRLKHQQPTSPLCGLMRRGILEYF